MTALARRDDHHDRPDAAPQVWVLTSGEFGEGGVVLGVYAEMRDAEPDMRDAVGGLAFAVDQVEQDPVTGAIRVEAGCDWLALVPYPVEGRGRPQPAP